MASMIKQSVYLDKRTETEMRAEGVRLERTLSWLVQTAWRLAREELQQNPTVTRLGPEEG